MVLLEQRLMRFQGPLVHCQMHPLNLRSIPVLDSHAELLQPMECPETVLSPFAQCPGTVHADEGAMQPMHPALLSSPSLHPVVYREQVQKMMEEHPAWQMASASSPHCASPSIEDHHVMHVPQKHCGWDRERSKFSCVRQKSLTAATWMLKKPSRN